MVYYTKSSAGGIALSAICFVLMMPTTVLPLAAYSYDLVVLSKESFEFWFLTILNVVGCCFCWTLLGDARVMAPTVASVVCQHGLLLDGNIHTRRLLLRTFVMASPFIFIALLAIVLHYTPRLRVSTIALSPNIEIDTMDVAVHCYSTLAIFIGSKVFHSRHLVFPSREPFKWIECSVYVPRCRLVPEETNPGPSTSSIRAIGKDTDVTSVRLSLVTEGMPHTIDTNDNIATFIRSFVPFRGFLWVNGLGYGGWMCSWISLIWLMAQPSSSGETPSNQLALASVGVISTLLSIGVFIANAPHVLLRRLLGSLDAWFVSFQFTVVTVGVCDSIQWDERVIFMVPMWLWCHWAMILDTLTPLMKTRLHLRRWFVRAVLMMLVVYPVLLQYWIFYSNAPGLRNRVLLSVSLFGSTVRMEAYSLLVSRAWTVCLWMGRFLWRELFRSADSFKLLKFRVEYPVTEAIWPT
ncbi:hypothetical protein Poli38472_010131 [Pythium oligandrum]|uniref:Uncharacterized protein n=1 Tax=Pythium oligandrum TaxID=41045 RepID=A0A8K1C9U4_PYTOL|nr:hypothetical protein Poli38472_010131 [Pythium oligandrum]|eukprot:TMW58572.1 hypothetical protein Poli38472_010131 [Pythium oligandrum]